MVKQNKGHWVTPFWHNDAHSRVTVTFGARRGTSTIYTSETGGWTHGNHNRVLSISLVLPKKAASAR